jgi:hypothetical protein
MASAIERKIRMKKTMYLTALVLICLALFFVSPSVAKEAQKKGKGGTKQVQSVCNSLKYSQIDKDTILITEGFSYQKNRELINGHLTGIQGVKEGNVFILDEGSVSIPDNESAVNVTWEFIKPDIAFLRDDCIYTSKVEGATIKFTKEGVLVKDFKISGNKKKKSIQNKIK